MFDDEERGSESDSTSSTDERAREGVEHLQAAAREVIAAARAMLDVAEEVVTDPAAASAVLSVFVSMTRMARQAATPADDNVRTFGEGGWGSDDDDPGVQHIPVV